MSLQLNADISQLKRQAGWYAVDCVESGMVVGHGDEVDPDLIRRET